MRHLFIYLHAAYWLVFNFRRFDYFYTSLKRGVRLEFAYDLAINLESRFDD